MEEFDRDLLAIITRHQSFEAQSLDAQERNAPYFDFLQKEPYFAFADILDAKGQELAGLPRTNQNWFWQEYFAALEHSQLDRPFVGKRFLIGDEQAVGFTLRRKLTDRNGNFSGVVVIGIRLAYFRELLSKLDLGPNDCVMLLRDDGIILLRLPTSQEIGIGNELGPLSPLYTALRGGLASVVALDPVDHVERHFELQRVATFHLVISVGIATLGASASHKLWPAYTVAGCVLVLAAGWLLWKRQFARKVGAYGTTDKSPPSVV
jgi:hypothetical protein